MPALPTTADLTNTSRTNAELRATFATLRAYLAELLGEDGTIAGALAALGAPIAAGHLTRTAATTLTAADRGRVVSATAGTWALTLPGAAAAGAGWTVLVRNTGTGTVTLTRAGSDLIDGASTLALASGVAVLVIGTGTGWLTARLGAAAGAGQIRGPDGSAAAPGLAFAADNNTGLFRPGSNEIGLAVAGLEQMRVTEAGVTVSGLLTGGAVQSGAADSTAGRLLTVGAFGAGITGTGLTLADLNAVGTPAGSYRFVSGTSLGTPPVEVNGYVEVRRYAADFLLQTFVREEGASRGQWTREYRTSAWTAWERVLRNHNLLGPASQSAGVPTGAVLERGSNANGEYTRFACGTQICWASATVTPVANIVTTQNFTWPAAFSAVPAAIANPRSTLFGPTDVLRVWHVSDRTTTGFTARVLRTNTTATGADVLAIGRWF